MSFSRDNAMLTNLDFTGRKAKGFNIWRTSVEPTIRRDEVGYHLTTTDRRMDTQKRNTVTYRYIPTMWQ